MQYKSVQQLPDNNLKKGTGQKGSHLYFFFFFLPFKWYIARSWYTWTEISLKQQEKKKKNIVSTQNHSEPLLPGFHKISANKKSVFRGLHFQEAIINYWRAGSNRRGRTVANLISVKLHYVIIIQTVFLKPLVK